LFTSAPYLSKVSIKDKNFEYALEELKKTHWEYSFVARLDEKEKNTRSLIFISKTLGIRAYVRNIN
jgi:RNase P protein component